MRFYLPFRVGFGQTDRLVFRTLRLLGRRFSYGYVNARPTLLVDPVGLQEEGPPCPVCKVEIACKITGLAKFFGQNWQHCYIKVEDQCDNTEFCISGDPSVNSRILQGLAGWWPFGEPSAPNYGRAVNDPEDSPCEGGDPVNIINGACEEYGESFLCDCLRSTTRAIDGKYHYSLDPGKMGKGINSNTFAALILQECLSEKEFTKLKSLIPKSAIGFGYQPKPGDLEPPPAKETDPWEAALRAIA